MTHAQEDDDSTNRSNKPATVISGTISDIVTKTDAKGRPYTRATITYQNNGEEPARITALAFGAAHASLNHSLTDGPIALYGIRTGNVFRMIKRSAIANTQ